jgi:hypothetical protein
MMRCSLDFLCILFCIKAKKYVGFGATPQQVHRRIFSAGDGNILPSRFPTTYSLPQNKCCGYENSAIKPKTPSNTEIFIAAEAFNSPAHFCLKGNNLHNPVTTCGQRRPCHCCLKAEPLQLHKRISPSAESEQTKRKFVIKIPTSFLNSQLWITPSEQSP